MSINHALDLLEKLDKLEIIDVVNGILSDEEYMGKIIGSLVNDTTLDLLTKWNNIVDLLNFLSEEETVSSLKTLLELVK